MTVILNLQITPKDLTQITDKQKRAVQSALPKAVLRVAGLGQQIIKQRTAKGRGINGTFPAYSPKYIEFRRKKLRKSDPTTVNLNATGQMLRSMQVKSESSRRAVIFFDNQQATKKANFNKRTRPFMGFNSKEKTRLQARFTTDIKAAVGRA
jgi:hypothetical protein